jgi:hypothetical protein
MSEEPEEVVTEPGSWEFIERPDRAKVDEMLRTLPDIFGVAFKDYIDYVIAMPQSKNVLVADESRPGVKIKQRLETWTLYVTVAGRMKMMQEAGALNGWRVDIEPEPQTPTGAAGFIQNGDGRIVYREYVSIWEKDEDRWRSIGRRPGTAWVPYSGGSGASETTPYEKVETAARGRALAAWGFGVLPGSGVASLDEVQNAAQIAAGFVRQPPIQHDLPASPSRMTHDEYVETIAEVSERLRQIRKYTPENMKMRVARFLSEDLQVKDVLDGDGNIRWDAIRVPKLELLLQAQRDILQQALAEGAPM